MRPATLPGKFAWLAAITGLLAAVMLLILWWLGKGAVPMKAVCASAAVCYLAGTLGMVASARLNRRHEILASINVGILIRMGIPLAAALAVQFLGAPLVSAGFLYYLLAFYLVTLATETFLTLPIQESRSTQENRVAE